MAKTTTSNGAVPAAQLEAYRDNDATLNWMIENNIPLTRDKYIFHSYAGKEPDPWTHEHEAELPEPLQDGSKIG